MDADTRKGGLEEIEIKIVRMLEKENKRRERK